MNLSESSLFAISWKEYALMLTAVALTYFVLRSDEWDTISGPISLILFFLLITIRYLSGISYLDLFISYSSMFFIEIWSAVCISVFYFFLRIDQLRMTIALRESILIGGMIFFLLFLVKLSVI